ncbi:unnamed protein product [Dibothriocephalus latus]|uniref:Uncharacterized protein n=1 Tax=Dibothriocephalus latus TaxID=60516 RepID=A0A3P7L610_DIBLA|nr:unnamed protein product [Dibothriocephalus latus]
MEMGMHETFTALVELTNLQEQRRLACGPESEEWTAPQLRDQVEKLQLIRDCLVEVEIARLSADYDAVFRGYLRLLRALGRKNSAENESEEADKWLVEYFLEKFLRSTREVTISLENMVTKEGQGENYELQMKLELSKQRAAEALFHVANFAFNDAEKLSESLLCLAEFNEPNMDQKACDHKLTLLTEACALAKKGEDLL